jgi:hypothetical protein
MPPIGTPPLPGRVVKIHRMTGHYVGEREAIVNIELAGIHILTLRAPEAGKIMRCRDVGDVVQADDLVTEITGVGEPTWELFVSYRHVDAPGHAGRVGDALIKYFGPGQVFRDIESQQPGQDFVATVREKLELAFCMVVVIGPGWANDKRLHDPDDLHREEIRTALNRGIHVIPVLVHGAVMPPAEELPEDIQPIVYRVAVEITDTRWDTDIDRVIKTTEQVLADSPSRQAFLEQVPPWGHQGWQYISNNPRKRR